MLWQETLCQVCLERTLTASPAVTDLAVILPVNVILRTPIVLAHISHLIFLAKTFIMHRTLIFQVFICPNVCVCMLEQSFGFCARLSYMQRRIYTKIALLVIPNLCCNFSGFLFCFKVFVELGLQTFVYNLVILLLYTCFIVCFLLETLDLSIKK